MTERIRIGVIGTSWYSGFLLSCLATCEVAEIAAICGRTRSHAEELAAKYPSAQVYTDYNEMIRNGRLDGVIVASPDDLHYPMVMAALKAKLHILAEKPLGLTTVRTYCVARIRVKARGFRSAHPITARGALLPNRLHLARLRVDVVHGRVAVNGIVNQQH